MMSKLSYFIGIFSSSLYSSWPEFLFFLIPQKMKYHFLSVNFLTTDSIDLSLDNILLYTLLVTDLVPEIGFTDTRNWQKIGQVVSLRPISNYVPKFRVIPELPDPFLTKCSCPNKKLNEILNTKVDSIINMSL